MEEPVYEYDDSFRDTIATADKEGKRIWVYPRKPKGDLTRLRNYATIVYLFLFFTLPFIKIKGEPFFLLNIIERKFVLFGMVFWPQDFFLLVLAMITFMVFIVLFTVVFGRAFCGWACPQTIFMEMVFRKIEYWIEGDSNQQRALAKAPWTGKKVFKKTLKHIVFFLIAFIISNTFLAYIIGIDQLLPIITSSPAEHMKGFISLLVFTGVFYWVFAWFREQVCTVVCPYGRLQGVLLDKNTIVVAYDYMRGEERGRFKRGEERESKGDCIDCGLCVAVCPTGIDIRNGTQLECVNCTACIDACDSIMDKVGFERGLIRYASENNIAKKEKLKLNTRIIAYSAVLLVLAATLGFMLAGRADVEATVLRTPGIMFQRLENERMSNLYSIKIVNKTHQDFNTTLKLENLEGEIKMIGQDTIRVAKGSMGQGEFFIILHNRDITETKTSVEIGIYENGRRIETVRSGFLGPMK